MSIDERVVEAAARAMFELQPAYMDTAGNKIWTWVIADEERSKRYFRNLARAALEAAEQVAWRREAADAIEARDGELKDAWMQRDALQETLREYQAVLQGRDAEIKQFEQLRDLFEVERGAMQTEIDRLRAELNRRHIATARDALENTILALKNDVSTANAEIEQLNEECKERRDEWARVRAAAERMAGAIEALEGHVDWHGDFNVELQELHASASAFREMGK